MNVYFLCFGNPWDGIRLCSVQPIENTLFPHILWRFVYLLYDRITLSVANQTGT